MLKAYSCRQAQFVILLKVDPDIRSRAEPPAKAQRRALLAEASRFSGYSVQALFLRQVGDKERTVALGIDNPPAGEYTLGVSTRGPSTDYGIIVAYSAANGKDVERIITGTVTRDEVQVLRFNVNGGLELR